MPISEPDNRSPQLGFVVVVKEIPKFADCGHTNDQCRALIEWLTGLHIRLLCAVDLFRTDFSGALTKDPENRGNSRSIGIA